MISAEPELNVNPTTRERWRCGDLHPTNGKIFRSFLRGKPKWLNPEAFEHERAKSAEYGRNKSPELRANIAADIRSKRVVDSEYRIKINAQQKARRQSNPERTAAHQAISREKSRLKRLNDHAWREANNAEKRNEEHRRYARNYTKARRQRDPLYALAYRCRMRVCKVLKQRGIPKVGKTSDMLGCDWDLLKSHIETLFTAGMSWDNRGKWHIDHIIPLNSAKDEESLLKLCHYTNLQPLWAVDNIRKGCRMPNTKP